MKMFNFKHSDDPNLQMSYFAEDGSYGDAKGMVIVNTQDFTEDDWMTLEIILEEYRPNYALELSNKYQEERIKNAKLV